MDARRWQLLEELFQHALTLPDAAAQRQFLESRHAEDASLVEEVLAMLREDQNSTSLLDHGIDQVADSVLGNEVPAGARFGPYTVERLLGEGGMGVVCLARRADLGSLAAIKLLRDAWLSPARRERFAVEQRVLAQLNHPGIARLYDAGTLNDGTPWFAMEYVEGVPLTDYCRTHGCAVERRLQLFRQACEAVRFAHAHAVIHRDIKPSNMLVKSDGSVKLLDFGIAKQLDGLEPAGGTRTVLRVMTPAYAAPEQLQGEKIGVHTDVYSLGVVAYELLTGRLPFSTQGIAVIENSAATGRIPIRPSQLARSAGETGAPGRAQWSDLDVLCLTAMHPDPARRYSSVEALLRDVDHYLRSEPLDARPDGFHYRAGKFLRRHWQMTGVVAAAVLLMLGLSTVFTLRLARARDAAQAEAARTERVQQLMTSLFQGGEPLAGPASNLKVVDVLDRGAREAEALTSDPAVQAELLHNLAGIYQKLGQYDKADSLFGKALALRTKLFGAASREAAENLVNLGLLRVDQGRLVEAEQLLRRGYELTARILPPQHPQAIAASLALGRMLRERGAHEQAIALLSQVMLRYDNDSAPLDRANALSELADAHYSAGHYETSRDLYQQVEGLHRRELGTTHPLVATDLGTLAAIQQDLGYYADAERLSRQALNIVESWYGEDSLNAADQLTSLGRALTYQKKNAEAKVTLERALAIQEKSLGIAHPKVAETLNEIGNVLATQGNHAAAAQRFAQAAGIYRNVYGDHHYLVGIALSNVAYMQMQQGKYAVAEPLFRQVIDLFKSTLGPDNVNTGIAHIKLGRTLLRAGRQRGASVETMAGYEILAKQTSPSISYLRAAREDLVAAHEALGQREQAARFREELRANGP